MNNKTQTQSSFTPDKNYPALLKISQVATETNLGRTTVYELFRSGRLHTVKIGKSVRVPRESLLRFLEELNEGKDAPFGGVSK